MNRSFLVVSKEIKFLLSGGNCGGRVAKIKVVKLLLILLKVEVCLLRPWFDLLRPILTQGYMLLFLILPHLLLSYFLLHIRQVRGCYVIHTFFHLRLRSHPFILILYLLRRYRQIYLWHIIPILQYR